MNKEYVPSEEELGLMFRCEYCKVVDETVILTPDPFASEIHGDETEHYICKDCCDNSHMDI